MNYWLFKTEPETFSLEDLKNSPNQTACWDGVRSYQARNFLRDEVQAGDRVLFYHSVKNPGIVGLARVVKADYPDHTAWDVNSRYYDPNSTPDRPIWYMVDVQFEQDLPRPLPLKFLRTVPQLHDMFLLRKGMRLSIQPVTQEEFKTILEYAANVTSP